VAVIAAAVFVGRGPSAQSTPLPFTFYLTHYELLGDPDDPSGVRYHSSGRPFAKAPGGSRIILTGHGGWDPASARATGGGEYTIRDHVKAALADVASCGAASHGGAGARCGTADRAPGSLPCRR
jgi:hypothetical protein